MPARHLRSGVLRVLVPGCLQSVKELSLYQEAPRGLARVFALGIASIACSLGICFLFRSEPVVFWWGVLLGTVALATMVYNLYRLLGLRRPILTLTKEYLLYGSWKFHGAR